MNEPKSRSDLRKSVIAIQVSADEKKRIQAAAEAVGMTTSTYCRYTLLKSMK